MNAGRPLEFDPDSALDSAMRLFWARGYESTSLQELLDHMGIARSSFYQTFHSKHDLFLRAVGQYRESLVGWMRGRLAASSSAVTFLRDTLVAVADDAEGDTPCIGCLVFNSATEFGQTDASVAAIVSASIDAFTKVFADAVVQAQREGEVAADRDPVALGRYMVCTMSGLQTLAKAGASRDEMLDLAEIALSAVH